MNEESGFVNCTSAWLYFLLRCYRRVCLCWWSRESGLCYKESLCSQRRDLGPKPKRFSFVSKKTCTLSLYAPRSTNYRWAKESWLERASKREKHREGMTIDGSLLLQEKKKRRLIPERVLDEGKKDIVTLHPHSVSSFQLRTRREFEMKNCQLHLSYNLSN